MRYVTYDESGDLTGCYLQDLLPEHEAAHLEIDEGSARNWVSFYVAFITDDFGVSVPQLAALAPPAYDLAADKIALNTEINAWREQANSSHFVYALHRIACDPVSFKDITVISLHISLFGTFTADFPGVWKTMDNAYIPMDTIDEFKAMVEAMGVQGTVNFNMSQAWKASKDAATTQAELNAIRAEMVAA